MATSGNGAPWPSPLDWEALSRAKGKAATPANIDRLSHATSTESARWAFDQWDLRRRAAAKFARASEMLFTREGLEMASHEAVAAYHASRFPSGELVIDLTCGIGADTLAFARRGPCIAFEQDPFHVACARHNLAVHGLEAEVRLGDSVQRSWPSGHIFLDPARREGGRRRWHLADYSPEPLALLARLRTADSFAIKLSPMLPDEDLRRFLAGIEFVSFGQECREALILSGAEGVAAVRIDGDLNRIPESPLISFRELPESFIYEADPAAIRAHALGWFNLAGLGNSFGYLTGKEIQSSPWLTCFSVLWAGAFHERSVKVALRDLGRNLSAVKLRGVDLNPSAVQKRLRSSLPPTAILILYRSGPRLLAAIVEKSP